MNLKGWQIHIYKKDKKSGISTIMSLPKGKKNDFLETKDWDYNVDWTEDSTDIDDFAVIFNTIIEIRKKYPYLYLLAIKPRNMPPWDGEAKFNGDQYPNTKLNITIAPPFDDTIITWDNDPATLVSVNNNMDLLQHAQAIWSHRTRIWFNVFLSKKNIPLDDIKNILESIKNSYEFKVNLLKYVEVAINLVYNEGFVDTITDDDEVVKAFLKNPKTSKFK